MKNSFLACLIASLLLSCPSFSQQLPDSFPNQWKEIDSLYYLAGLPKSAITQVNALYKQASRKKNEPQTIKSLIYEMGIAEEISEEETYSQINRLQKEIQNAFSKPQKSILQVLLAKQYFRIWSNGSWTRRSSQTIIDDTTSDVKLWPESRLRNVTDSLYNQALAPVAALQAASIRSYAAIIIPGTVGDSVQHDLYDLLLRDAIDYCKTAKSASFDSDDSNIIEETAFLPAKDFIRQPFPSTKGYDAKILSYYQQLLSYHLKEAKLTAFLSTDIERIQWVFTYSQLKQKDSLYLRALDNITQQYSNETAAAEAWYLTAAYYATKADNYQSSGDSLLRYGYVKAKAIIDQQLAKKLPESEGKAHMQQLLQQITASRISTVSEKINIPEKPFRLYVSYKNAPVVFGRLLRYNAAPLPQTRLSFYQEKIVDSLLNLSPWKQIKQSLPVVNDYQQHAAEIKIDALPAGRYILLLSSDSTFRNRNGQLSIQMFDVTSISYVYHDNDFFVLNRETGAPMVGASVHITGTTWDAKSRSYKPKPTSVFNTDKNGHFSRGMGFNGQTSVMFTYRKDTLVVEAEYYYDPISSRTTSEEENVKVHFFTDRSIYRPGQTIFLKGIAVNERKRNQQPSTRKEGDSLRIFLYNSNNIAIDSLTLRTNTYGSFTGQFQLPAQILTGGYNLTAGPADTTATVHYNGYSSVQIEEYKRPKFYVSFDTLSNNYRLNDTITLTGRAKAYAGNNIAGAKVTYSVTRNANFPYPWLYRGIGLPYSNATTITNGVVNTNEQGVFTIKFPATPDASVSPKLLPVFTFSATAAVTDLSGETRESQTGITAGYHALQVSLDLPATAETRQFKTIPVSVKNLSGKDIPSTVALTIYPIQPPERLIRNRYWKQPDQFVMSYSEFIRNFPNDEYKDEQNVETWPRKAAITQATYAASSAAGAAGGYVLNKPLPVGWYVIEAKVADNKGDTLKDLKYIQIFDKNSAELPQPAYQWTNIPDAEYLPGDTLRLLSGSSVKERFVIQFRKQTSENKGQYSYTRIKKGLQKQQYRIQTKDLGGFQLSDVFVCNNRIYTNSRNIRVAYPDKTLTVSYKTFRDKTLPGSKETWSVQVKNEKGAAEAAELLTAMYDASLDQFKPHSWGIPAYWPAGDYNGSPWSSSTNFNSQYGYVPYISSVEEYYPYNRSYNRLVSNLDDFEQQAIVSGVPGAIPHLSFRTKRMELSRSYAPTSAAKGTSEDYDRVAVRGAASLSTAAEPLYIVDGVPTAINNLKAEDIASMEILKNDAATSVYGARAANGAVVITTKGNKSQAPVQVRKQFNETAFFFPQLHADKEGNYTFSFTMPEALTQWKWLSLAHTRNLAFGSQQQLITTQKSLMAQVNAPRFIRQGDQLTLVATISNLDTATLNGQVKLELLNAATMQPVDLILGNTNGNQQFNTTAGQSATITFPLNIPSGYLSPITYRITAEAGDFSDGEENTIPVLPNRMLVTETVPLQLRGNTSQSYRLDKLLQQKANSSLQTESITIEYTTNPAWQALQSLPYLVEYPYECAEQTFNRLYANKLASFLVHKTTTFANAFNLWQKDTTALLGNLEKNQPLQQLLLAETPWVAAAKNETAQRQRLVKLFVNEESANTTAAVNQLEQIQREDGSFSWFKGGSPDRYITTYIVTGIGKLTKLGAMPTDTKTNNILSQAIAYLDDRMTADYQQLLALKANLKQDYLTMERIQYLYARSFFPSIAFRNDSAYQFLLTQAASFWNKQNNYNKALLAAVLYRNGKEAIARESILPSILQNAITDKEKGMYWKDRITCFWHPSPIEHQSAIMLSVAEISKGSAPGILDSFYREMRTWLILNKQTNNWGTTTATADACYAILADVSDLNSSRQVTIQIGDSTIQSAQENQEAGTGYFTKRLQAAEVTPAMGNIKVTTFSRIPDAGNQSNVSYGAIHWQYFEDMNKITAPAGNPLAVEKKLFLEKASDKGTVLEAVGPNAVLKTGDKVIVQLIVKADRDIAYVHLKDMRAASMEPVNVLSGYKWADRLSYYEANKDASTSFFIDHLRKGTYIVSYPVYLTHAGKFTAGIATASCMYAPSFSSHSEGRQLEVKQ